MDNKENPSTNNSHNNKKNKDKIFRQVFFSIFLIEVTILICTYLLPKPLSYAEQSVVKKESSNSSVTKKYEDSDFQYFESAKGYKIKYPKDGYIKSMNNSDILLFNVINGNIKKSEFIIVSKRDGSTVGKEMELKEGMVTGYKEFSKNFKLIKSDNILKDNLEGHQWIYSYTFEEKKWVEAQTIVGKNDKVFEIIYAVINDPTKYEENKDMLDKMFNSFELI